MSIRFINLEGKTLDSEYCFRDLNILSHAQLIEHSLGSTCGGHGICGKDKIRCVSKNPVSDFSEITQKEHKHLTEKELSEGWRLGCQMYPESNSIDADFESAPEEP